jgi:hypothetical protein
MVLIPSLYQTHILVQASLAPGGVILSVASVDSTIDGTRSQVPADPR